MLKKYSFSKDFSIKTPTEFKTIKRQGVKFLTPIFYCYWKFSKRESKRIGVTISKRQVRFAVRRNKIKRRFKEWFRLNQHLLPNGDYVFIVTRRAAQMNTNETFEFLDSFYQKLKKHCKLPA